MNLKAAARRLGVHYQTAYRLVRAGDLIAIKVGAGYEISEAAIERYLAGRHALGVAATTELAATATERRAAPAAELATSAAAVAAELDALMAITTLSTRPVLDIITRHLGETIGDFAILRLISEDGKWLVGASSHHHDPAKRALIAAMVSQPQPVEARIEQPTLHDGLVHRVDFVRVDVARYLIPPAFQQYADRMTIYSLLSVPIIRDRNHVVGMITMARDLPGRPYTADEQVIVTEMAQRAAAAIERVDRFSTGWNARQTLHDRIEALLAAHPHDAGGDLVDIVVPLFDDTVPEALFDLDRQMVACNEPFARRVGLAPGMAALGGGRLGALDLTSCIAIDEDDVWTRLISGETDYLDQLSSACEAGCPVADGVHWAVARRPDATPAFVIATCSAEPRAGRLPDGQHCWLVCEVNKGAVA